jgi:hypothetical protein
VNVAVCEVGNLIENVALMKVSAWHKALGDTVTWFEPLWGEYDVVYASKPFTYTPDNPYLPPDTIRGGTGYNLDPLPFPNPDTIYPDYSLYPGMTQAIGRITRGCVHRCPFCMVWKQDGSPVRKVAELHDFWRGQHTHLRLLDDNLLAYPEADWVLLELQQSGLRVSFEALDARFLVGDIPELLMRVKRWGNLRFAWDSIKDEAAICAGIANLKRVYPSLHDVLVYVLIGYDSTPEEDLYRVEKLRSLGAMPFVMPFDKHDAYQKRFARWVNHKAIFRSVPWERYRDGMGHGKAMIA